MAERLFRLIERRNGNWRALIAPYRPASSVDVFLADILPGLTDSELRNLLAHLAVELGNMDSAAADREPFRSCDWRLLTFCFANSTTLREAVSLMADLCEAVDGRLGWIELISRDGRTYISMNGDPGDDQELAFSVTLNAILLFHEIFGWLIGRPIEGTGHLAFPEPCREWIDESLLPFQLHLDSDFSGFSIPADWLDLRVIRSATDFEPQIMARSLFAYTVESEPHEIANRARAIIRSMLREEAVLPSLDELGKMLSIGRMTLRRRLAAADTSFQDIRDSVRREYALELLSRSNHSIEALAEQLDYCDSDAFRAAFKGWTGLSPSDYRRRMRSMAASAES